MTTSGKRQRGSPMQDIEPSMNSSSKRIKMIDESASDSYSTMTNFSSAKSSPLYDASSIAPLHEEYCSSISHGNIITGIPNHMRAHIPHQITAKVAAVQEHQSAGQGSSEPPPGYQSMNSLLGNLHQLRRQRASNLIPQRTAQLPMQQVQSTRMPQSCESQNPTRRGHKKKVALRVSSNLF